MSLSACVVDAREPDWVLKLQFGGVPTSTMQLESGDFLLACDDGTMIVVERKTPNDFLNTLRDDRLFPQMEGLVEMRKQGYWPYLLVTGEFATGQGGKVFTDRETGWNMTAVTGALLSVQELGIFVTHCQGDTDLEAALIRLANRSHKPEMMIQPVREAKIMGVQSSFLCGLPGIGMEKVSQILNYCGTAAWALCALTDDFSQIPGVGPGIKNNVRYALGLKDNEQLGILINDHGDEVLQIMPLGAQ